MRVAHAVATGVAAVGALGGCGGDDAADARKTAATWLWALAVAADVFRPIELRLTGDGWRVVSGLRPAP